jgi:hypothetical protein
MFRRPVPILSDTIWSIIRRYGIIYFLYFCFSVISSSDSGLFPSSFPKPITLWFAAIPALYFTFFIIKLSHIDVLFPCCLLDWPQHFYVKPPKFQQAIFTIYLSSSSLSTISSFQPLILLYEKHSVYVCQCRTLSTIQNLEGWHNVL